MFTSKTAAGALLAAMIATPTFAEIMVMDAYARAASPVAKSAAAFMVLHNTGDNDDALIAVRTDAAAVVELHTHVENTQGVMRMVEIEGGIPVPAGQMHQLARGADHVMLMGLTAGLRQGDEITVTLTFEHAGEVDVTMPVDNDRKDGGHGAHSH